MNQEPNYQELLSRLEKYESVTALHEARIQLFTHDLRHSVFNILRRSEAILNILLKIQKETDIDKSLKRKIEYFRKDIRDQEAMISALFKAFRNNSLETFENINLPVELRLKDQSGSQNEISDPFKTWKAYTSARGVQISKKRLKLDDSGLVNGVKLGIKKSHSDVIFQNLIDNAVKFALENTTIEFRSEVHLCRYPD